MTITLLTGDVRDVLPTLPANSVQCVVTSPPYYGLRDYGVAGQLGLEPTPDAYLATMVAVFREVRRVMRDDAVAFVNMGDSFSGKQLLMMPARVALALQADGWWLRSDIIWAKPNPMPESVTDRPTSAHEHVFLLTKRSRYFYDADAVREGDDVYTRKAGGYTTHAAQMADGKKPYQGKGGFADCDITTVGRNLRNVWQIVTAPFPAAHFATFPPALAERCIKAGTSERGCCAACGAPWVRTTDVSYTDAHRGMVGNQVKAVTDSMVMHAGREADKRMDKHVTTTGWSPSCTCDLQDGNKAYPDPPVPCVVLDPFSGAGTALLVADRLGRNAIGIDLSHSYMEMARERLVDDCPLFADLSPPPANCEDAYDRPMRDLFEEAAD